MPAPTNVSAATAIDIGTTLPYSVTQNAHFGGVTYDLWYRYTAQVSDTVIGFFGFGDLSIGGYEPVTTIYTGPASVPTSYLANLSPLPNVPGYMAVTPGTTYYFKFDPGVPNPTPAILTLTVYRHTNAVAPIGSLAINEDTGGAALVIGLVDADSSPSETVLQYVGRDAAVGEAAAVRDDGILALVDRTAVDANGVATARNAIIIYDSQYTQIGTYVLPISLSPANGETKISDIGLTVDAAGDFYFITYVIVAAPPVVNTIRKIDSAGTLLQSWTIGSFGGASDKKMGAIAVNPAGTIAYFCESAITGTSTIVYSWDLVADVALPNFLTGGTYLPDLYCLANGNLVIGDHQNNNIRVYNPAGVQQSSFAVSAFLGTERMARGLTETTVWLWFKTTPFHFTEYTLATGAVVRTFTYGRFGRGLYKETPTATPVQSFGHSDSCPFWITRTAASPSPPAGLNGPPALEYFEANGQLVGYPIVRVRRAPHLADEQQRIFYSKFELDIESGVGTVTGQGSDPVLELRWSNDGGFTWTGWRSLGVGKLGEYRYRCIARQLGSARDRVFEVRQSDPVKSVWLGAYLDLEEGTS